MLSTRPDLIPEDIALELARLQDDVPSFPGEQAREVIEQALGAPLEQHFADFQLAPMASASVAQVHAATLHDGTTVVVKVLRPGIEAVIEETCNCCTGWQCWPGSTGPRVSDCVRWR